MRYVAAYLLAVLGSNTNPSAGDIDKILSSVGIESDSARVKQVLSELQGKDLDTLMKEGLSKLASMPSGGGAAAAPAAAAASSETKEEKKEEKKVESESEDEDMGFGLFD